MYVCVYQSALDIFIIYLVVHCIVDLCSNPSVLAMYRFVLWDYHLLTQ